MKSRSRKLAEHSINSALSAIEIYNKPDFRDREQIFSVLMTVAWETLLKARVLQLNGNRLNSLYLKDSSGHFKRNRNNRPFTIDVYEALRRCKLDSNVVANIGHLVEIRDTAVHMTAESPTLPYLVFTLGTASLRNYVKLIAEWFGVSLTRYHFYILPLGFASPFKTLKMADLDREPEEIRSLINAVSADQHSLVHSDDYHFICEVTTTLVSAKKITQETDLIAALDPNDPNAIVVQRNFSSLDQYPLSAQEVWQAIKKELPGAKQAEVWNAIKELDVKGNRKYSKHSYRTKADEAKGPKKTTAVIYNRDAVKMLLEHLSNSKVAAKVLAK